MVSINKSTQRELCKYDTAWCPGCGNYGIQTAIAQAVNELELDPHQTVFVAGIGQAAKMPQYLSANRFCGLHGRALPAAISMKIANDKLNVIVNTGDGDGFGEGGNHFLANVRRNVNITHIAHDNQVYGLTKGQASPTAPIGMTTGVQTEEGVTMTPFNPVAQAILLGAGFAARVYSGDKDQLVEIIKEAIQYDGYALVDVLQPCVSFNKTNTYEWYQERVKALGDDYDPSDYDKALETAQIFNDEEIPTGIFYKKEKTTYKDSHEVLKDGEPLMNKGASREFLEEKIRDFA